MDITIPHSSQRYDDKIEGVDRGEMLNGYHANDTPNNDNKKNG
jgi:hypothetical protein